MTLADWISETRQRIAEEGWGGVQESGYELWLGILRRTDQFVDPGTNIFDRDWEVLIILDGCRTDAMEEVDSEYEFLDTPGIHRSPGSASYQWMDRTFTEDYAAEMSKTAYVTANPFSDQYFDDGDFAILEEVWQDSWDDEKGIVPARPVTDRAIHLGRECKSEFDRLIVHYMQPHFPSIPQPLGSGSKLNEWRDGREMAWQGLRRGDLTEYEVWSAYIENLRYVLDDVAFFLENFTADRVVLTADHGNAKGEFGIYGHPNVPLKVLREVPWYVTSATDEGTRELDDELGRDSAEGSVTDRLKALGYRD